MADPTDPGVVEQILEPAPARAINVAGEHYPWLFSFTGEDVLEVTSWNSLAGVRITVQGRVYTGPQAVKPFQASHTPTSDRTATTTVHSVPRGELLNVIAYCDAGAPLMGQTFVRVAVRRGAGAAFIRLGLLIHGPITASVARAWPGSAIVTATESEPLLRNIVGTQPAAGAEISETVPTGARWELVSWYAYMLKNANGGPFELRKQSGGSTYIAVVANHAHNVGASINYYCAQGFNLVMAGPPATGSSMHALPTSHLLAAGDAIVTSLVNNAGDQWSAPYMTVREWLDI